MVLQSPASGSKTTKTDALQELSSLTRVSGYWGLWLMGVSENQGYFIWGRVLIIRILLFRVLYQDPLFSETDFQTKTTNPKCRFQRFRAEGCGSVCDKFRPGLQVAFLELHFGALQTLESRNQSLKPKNPNRTRESNTPNPKSGFLTPQSPKTTSLQSP